MAAFSWSPLEFSSLIASWSTLSLSHFYLDTLILRRFPPLIISLSFLSSGLAPPFSYSIAVYGVATLEIPFVEYAKAKIFFLLALPRAHFQL